MELHEHPLGRCGERSTWCTQRAAFSSLSASSGRYRGLSPPLPRRQELAAILGQPHPGGRDGDGQLVRISRPRADRVQAEPAAARLPVRARGLLPQSGVDLPAAFRRHGSGRGLRDLRPRTRSPRPRPGRSPRSARAPDRHLRATRCRRPAPSPRPDLRRCRRSSVRRTARSRSRTAARCAGSRVAKSTGCPANARVVISNADPGSPSSRNRPFLVPTSSSVTLSASCYRR